MMQVYRQKLRRKIEVTGANGDSLRFLFKLSPLAPVTAIQKVPYS